MPDNVPRYTVRTLGLAEFCENSADPQFPQNQVLMILPESAVLLRTSGCPAARFTASAGNWPQVLNALEDRYWHSRQ